jgi:hypothetical protein
MESIGMLTPVSILFMMSDCSHVIVPLLKTHGRFFIGIQKSLYNSASR